MRAALRSAVVLACVTATVVLPTGAATGAEPASGTYLALGDSVPAGYVSRLQPVGPSYVDAAAGRLRGLEDCGVGAAAGCTLEVQNLSVPGQTTADFIAKQLPGAVTLLAQRNGNASPDDDVRLVTLTIGGNDVFGPVLAACGPKGSQAACASTVPRVLEAVSSGYATILAALREAAGPETTIALTTYYNPLGACFLKDLEPLADAVLEGGALGVEAGVNDIVRARARGVGAVVAELGGGLLGAQDFIGGQDCLHPDASGHDRIGVAVAAAVSGFSLASLSGGDRYETSAAIAATFGAARGVVLASGEPGRTPDALAASVLAGVRDVPVLLTARDAPPAPVLAELRRRQAQGASTITIVGGDVAVSEAQEQALEGLGFTVDRLAGRNRFETAREIVEAVGSAASTTGLIASGTSTIDALAGGPLAFRGQHPMLLVTRDGIPSATLEAIAAAKIRRVYVLGGEAVVGPEVVAEIEERGIDVVDRLAGADRSATSVAIAEEAVARFGFTEATFDLALGSDEGGDALGGAALSGKLGRPLLVASTPASAGPVLAYARASRGALDELGFVYGGPAAVRDSLVTAVEQAAGADDGIAPPRPTSSG
jgi:putative cell wall-binding protein/lysophospholipase L1-like esterase